LHGEVDYDFIARPSGGERIGGLTGGAVGGFGVGDRLFFVGVIDDEHDLVAVASVADAGVVGPGDVDVSALNGGGRVVGVVDGTLSETELRVVEYEGGPGTGDAVIEIDAVEGVEPGFAGVSFGAKTDLAEAHALGAEAAEHFELGTNLLLSFGVRVLDFFHVDRRDPGLWGAAFAADCVSEFLGEVESTLLNCHSCKI